MIPRLTPRQVGGSRVRTEPAGWRLTRPAAPDGYANAQLDDDGDDERRILRWRPGTTLQLDARFSHSRAALGGTAGFGFWNAAFADRRGRLPRLPQAAWFFFGSAPNDLPFTPDGTPGRGWFAATIDAGAAWPLAPLAPAVLLANQCRRARDRLRPWWRRHLGIAFAPVPDEHDMRTWRRYAITWLPDQVIFRVDGNAILRAPSPGGPLSLVLWLDNQFLVATADGRVRWGIVPTVTAQWLDIRHLAVAQQ